MPKGDYGLFVKNPDPTSHYLIETNPAFASLSGFFSSDYMLGKLGFNADNAWRRLGEVSTINNRGNLGAVFKDVTSSDAMKGYVIAGATAGMTATYFGGWTGTETNTSIGKITTPGLLNSWSGVGRFAANQTLQSGTSMLLSKALGQGGNASDALKSALFNTLAAASFNLVGNYTEGVFADGSVPKIAIHAMVGGLLAEATGGDFKTGALAAGANEALVTHLNTLVKGNQELLSMSSQIVGVLAAAGQSDATAAQMEKGGWVAKNATQYNHALHKSQTEALDEQRRFHPEKADRLNAAACALAQCAESIPTDHPNYGAFKDLQDRGATFATEIALLKATGQFDGRSYTDWSDDTINAHGSVAQTIGATADTAFGILGGVGGYAGMALSSPACVGVVTCIGPISLGALGTTSMLSAWDSAGQITAPFTSTEPDRVAASFYPGTFPGESSVTSDLAVGAVKSTAISALFGAAAGKYFGGKVGGELVGGAKATGQIDNPPVKNGWKVGDDVYNQTAKGNDPSWSAVRSRFWKNESAAPDAAKTYGPENLDRMSKGLAPQRYNAAVAGAECNTVIELTQEHHIA